MTDLLEQAMPDGKPRCVYAKLKSLPANQQDAMATMILEELEDEQRSC